MSIFQGNKAFFTIFVTLLIDRTDILIIYVTDLA